MAKPLTRSHFIAVVATDIGRLAELTSRAQGGYHFDAVHLMENVGKSGVDVCCVSGYYEAQGASGDDVRRKLEALGSVKLLTLPRAYPRADNRARPRRAPPDEEQILESITLSLKFT